jgi:hypothetical protein
MRPRGGGSLGSNKRPAGKALDGGREGPAAKLKNAITDTYFGQNIPHAAHPRLRPGLRLRSDHREPDPGDRGRAGFARQSSDGGGRSVHGLRPPGRSLREQRFTHPIGIVRPAAVKPLLAPQINGLPTHRCARSGSYQSGVGYQRCGGSPIYRNRRYAVDGSRHRGISATADIGRERTGSFEVPNSISRH